jgi:glycosyltransferase involved in cell wall biosynthesis
MAPKVPQIALPSPVITSKFISELGGAAPEHPWLIERVPIILGVGRLSVPKDFPTLLRAFALLRSQRELRLVILGDGPDPYRQELVALARKLGIEEDVDLPGWSSNVPNWLSRASVFVSTSIWEGSPGAIIEALAAGCPIVATDCPGATRRLLRNGQLGGLAPIGDFRTIAKLVEMMLEIPPDPAMLKAAAAPYREEFAAAAYLDALDGFIADWPARSP